LDADRAASVAASASAAVKAFDPATAFSIGTFVFASDAAFAASSATSDFVDYEAAIFNPANPNPSAAFDPEGHIWMQVRDDARAIEAGQDALTLPLWSIPLPDWFTEKDAEARAIWARDPNIWSFWNRWWDGVLTGNQLNSDLQRQVALIPDEIWEQGPAAVAGAIRQIELDFAIAHTPNAEEVRRDGQGLFYTLPVSTIRPDLFRAAIEKVQDDIVEIRAAPHMANCLPFFEADLRRLDDHFARYADQPLRIHDVYLKTLRHIEALQRQGLLPVDTLIEDLHQDLDTGAVDIRRSDSEVAKTVKARIGDRLARIKVEKRAEAEAAVNGAAAESRDDLKQELKQDFATVTDPAAEPVDKDESSYRLSSRLLRMGKKRKDDMVKTADDIGKVSRGAEGLSKGAEAAQGWWDWVIASLSGMAG
jgi:hypothetical protein